MPAAKQGGVKGRDDAATGAARSPPGSTSLAAIVVRVTMVGAMKQLSAAVLDQPEAGMVRWCADTVGVAVVASSPVAVVMDEAAESVAPLAG